MSDQRSLNWISSWKVRKCGRVISWQWVAAGLQWLAGPPLGQTFIYSLIVPPAACSLLPSRTMPPRSSRSPVKTSPTQNSKDCHHRRTVLAICHQSGQWWKLELTSWKTYQRPIGTKLTTSCVFGQWYRNTILSLRSHQNHGSSSQQWQRVWRRLNTTDYKETVRAEIHQKCPNWR